MGKRKKKFTLSKYLSDALEVPLDDITGGFFIGISEGCQLCIRGCEGITDYTGNRVTVKAKGGSVTIEGVNLDIVYYTDSEITLRGDIHSVVLGGGTGPE
ncbi:MAG: YabP/YqfC family sporulation protein [Eubacteriales bacterium]|jgi:sporulation protein YqfC|nr:hypothetical protein [Clostridiales bacterium]